MEKILPVLAWATLLFAGSACGAEPVPERPNVVLINADDLGYGDTGAYGATHVRTPNIDRLAREGMRFLDAHSTSAVCSPSRYGLMTGRFPVRRNFWLPLFLDDPLVIDESRLTIAGLMKRAGYATAAIGKWHLGFGHARPVDWNAELAPGPLELGFDYYFGVPVLNSHPPFVFVENHRVLGLDAADPFVRGERALTREFDEKFMLDAIGGAAAAHAEYRDREIAGRLKSAAVDWIRGHRDGPFFLYLATTNIHHPFTPAPEFIASSDAGPYGDSIQEFDWVVGEVLRVLREEGLAGNTLVVLTSDNGGMLNRGGQNAWEAGHRLNGDLLGFKFGAWEGGHRIPLIVRWPGVVPAGGSSAELLSQADLMATLAAIVRQPLGEDEAPDSVNMLPTLLGTNPQPLRDHLVVSAASRRHLLLRKGKWAYIPARGEGGFSGQHPGNHDFGGPAALGFTGRHNSDVVDGAIREDAPEVQLYDLDADPSETTNVAAKYPQLVEEFDRLLDGYRQD